MQNDIYSEKVAEIQENSMRVVTKTDGVPMVTMTPEGMDMMESIMAFKNILPEIQRQVNDLRSEISMMRTSLNSLRDSVKTDIMTEAETINQQMMNAKADLRVSSQDLHKAVEQVNKAAAQVEKASSQIREWTGNAAKLEKLLGKKTGREKMWSILRWIIHDLLIIPLGYFLIMGIHHFLPM